MLGGAIMAYQYICRNPKCPRRDETQQRDCCGAHHHRKRRPIPKPPDRGVAEFFPECTTPVTR